jgi:drug/metabolite transporter superfamily protein YnfA
MSISTTEKPLMNSGNEAPRVASLRRKAVITAAFCAILGGFIPLLGLHGHRWIAFAGLGAQAVLLVTALSFFVKSNRPARNQ